MPLSQRCDAQRQRSTHLQGICTSWRRSFTGRQASLLAREWQPGITVRAGVQGAGVCAQEIEGMEVVLVRSRTPRGLLMVFHGCQRRPTDWWHYEPTCVTCIGVSAPLMP